MDIGWHNVFLASPQCQISPKSAPVGATLIQMDSWKDMMNVTVAFHSNANLCKNDASCKTLMRYCDLLLVSKWLQSVSSSFAVIEARFPDVI